MLNRRWPVERAMISSTVRTLLTGTFGFAP